jgi:PilZ domain
MREHAKRSWVKTVSSMQVTTGPSRRRTSRVPIADSVWVYWESPSGRDVSRVKDLSPSGLFIETRARKRQGDLLNLHFLVQEGQIRAEAVVRHAAAGRGLGMKISSVSSQDAPHLHRLLMRLREAPKVPPAPTKPAGS